MENKRIIYCLKCPFTNEIHYIGKSSNGMIRPLSHMKKSHSNKINEWVNELKTLGLSPLAEVIEYVSESGNIDEKELYHIQKSIKKGNNLLNISGVTPISISNTLEYKIDNGFNKDIRNISKFIKIRRKKVNLTQEEFAERTGVALTVIRKIEQGKTNINVNSLLQILKMFGSTINVVKINTNT